MSLCVVIQGPSLALAEAQIREAEKYATLVEWRLDLFETCDLALLKALKERTSIDTIFTLRPPDQGGKWLATEDARLAKIEELASLLPTYIDLEHTVSVSFIDQLRQKYPSIKIISSHHDFDKTPPDLEACLNELQQIPAHSYKIACMAHSALDTYAVLAFAKRAPSNCMLMTMGPTGHLSRILAPVFARPITYVPASDVKRVVVGQISAQELQQIYGYATLSPSTAVYGLIGDPVDMSPSHVSHNEVMRRLQLASVYVKTPILPQELGQYLCLAKQIGIKGLSVTIPHKEAVMQYCDSITKEAASIGAVNTLQFINGKIIGSNTDGPGALDALEAHIKVAGKQIVVLGAGGAARAIAWQAKQQGADVLVCNRNKERAQKLAYDIGCRGGGFDAISSNYRVIINATAHENPIDPECILSGAIAMDIRVRPKETLFLQEAKKRGCTLVYGYEMFIKQAALQFKTWFNDIDIGKAEQLLMNGYKNA